MTTTHAPRRGGWYHGWNIVAVAVISQIAAYGLPLNSISLFLNDWARDLHSPISHLLLAMAPLAWVSAIASPIAGALADKRRARWLFGIGLAGIGLFCYLMSTVTATWQLCLLYGTLYPVSVSLCTSVAATALVSRWFVRRIGLALGVRGASAAADRARHAHHRLARRLAGRKFHHHVRGPADRHPCRSRQARRA